MKTINLQVNGKPLIFSGKSVSYAGHELFYSKMSNIAHRGGTMPAYIFDYDGKRLALPYDPKDKDITLKIFKQVVLLEKKRAAQEAKKTAEPADEPVPEPGAEPESIEPAAEEPASEEPAAEVKPNPIPQPEPEYEKVPEPSVSNFAEPDIPEPSSPALPPEEEEFTMYYVPSQEDSPVSESPAPAEEENTKSESPESASDFILFDVPPDEDTGKSAAPEITPQPQKDPVPDQLKETQQEQPPVFTFETPAEEPAPAEVPAESSASTQAAPIEFSQDQNTIDSSSSSEAASDNMPKKPIYKRGWFIFVIILVIIGIISIITAAVGAVYEKTPAAGSDTAAPAAAEAQDTSSTATYESILNDYTQQIKEATPKLIEEYNSEAKESTGSIDELSEISMKKVEKLAAINNKGIEEMSQLMAKNGDSYETYEKWATELISVYEDYAAQIMDAYTESAL